MGASTNDELSKDMKAPKRTAVNVCSTVVTNLAYKWRTLAAVMIANIGAGCQQLCRPTAGLTAKENTDEGGRVLSVHSGGGRSGQPVGTDYSKSALSTLLSITAYAGYGNVIDGVRLFITLC